ncbi:hypothetical protein [Roseobacter sp. N2S]|uniref:hypothetical protein n=1 Tax=Roseobacter sp. N2S TaxID=2663844 RepID=UPI00285A1055|nr:hypothetical protein [Roseobacter sp. N2S]MDR6264227.1 hypothetical protein [Roseobacter sp. N2S]
MRHVLIALCCLPRFVSAEGAQPHIYQLPSGEQIRAAPPTGGFLNLPGRVTGQTDAKNPYVVLRDHTVQQGFRNTQWAEVAPISEDGSINEQQSGWIILPKDQAVDQQLKPYEGQIPETTLRQIQTNIQNYKK